MANFSAGNIITKTIGAGGLGLVLYDAHCAAKIRSKVFEKNHKSENLEKNLYNTMSLDSPSVVKAATKKRIFKYFVDENISGFFTSIFGYAKGFGSMLVSDVIPLALALGTLLMPSKGKLGIFSKMFGAGLLAYGGIYILQEMFGIGKPRH